VKRPSDRTSLIICAAIVIATAAVYVQVWNHELIAFDDYNYLKDNHRIAQGLSFSVIKWAFTSFHASNWHPLTWVSHALDVSLFGANYGMHHVVSLLLHLANTTLLFVLLNRLTGSSWRSGFVAALFALHPLHVESVAWAAERKDVLSALFWMLTCLAYVSYVKHGGRGRYAAAVVFYALGLMAKPMLVSLPLVLLMLDIWPIDRVTPAGKKREKPSFWRLIVEKVPLIALAAASCAVTMFAQSSGDAMVELTRYPLGARLANAAVGTAGYLVKMVWPMKLLPFYPHRGTGLPILQVIASYSLIATLTLSAVALRKRAPYAFTGWFWYLIALMPVVGLVQVGEQGMADRYTYITLIGVFIAISWGAPDLLRGVSARATTAAALAALCTLAYLTYQQVGRWKDGVSLFEYTVKTDPSNFKARNLLGIEYVERGRVMDARLQFEKALSEAPSYAEPSLNMAISYYRERDFGAALHWLEATLRTQPNYGPAHKSLAVVLFTVGDVEGARREAELAQHYGEMLHPGFVQALQKALAQQRQ